MLQKALEKAYNNPLNKWKQMKKILMPNARKVIPEIELSRKLISEVNLWYFTRIVHQ